MKYQLMTPERLASIQEAMGTMTRRDLLKHFNVSSRTLTKYAITKSPAQDRRLALVQPHQIEMVRELSALGLSERVIAEKTGLSGRQVQRTKHKYQIPSVPLNERPKAEKPPKPEKKATPKNNGRNPMQSLQQWKPPVANTSLERVVDDLRSRYSPVCAEATIKYASRVPAPYTHETLFRVGTRQNVTADELVSM